MLMMLMMMSTDQASTGSERLATSWQQDTAGPIKDHHHHQQHKRYTRNDREPHREYQVSLTRAAGDARISTHVSTASTTASSSIAAAALLASASASASASVSASTSTSDIIMSNSASTAHNHHLINATISDNQQQNILISDLLVQCINLNLVRKMIAQNLVEFLIICVIITYLIYYFTIISKRPRLIGNSRSQFVKLIEKNLSNTLKRRFSPLIYFWGTNPQTALFGYLQGKSSLHEVPRSHFKRQYLYVSDAQYLTSNVDLSEHYEKMQRHYPMQLQVCTAQRTGNLLDQNIRLVLDELLANGRYPVACSEGKEQVEVAQLSSNKKSDRLSRGSSSGSSSDSGVFPGHSSSSSSSSTSSLAATAETNHEQQLSKNNNLHLQVSDTHCACKLRYESQPLPLDSSPSAAAAAAAQSNKHPFKKSSSDQPLEQLEFGQCALDWHRASHKHYHSNKLVALISAGMTTGSDKKYVTDTVTTLEKLGYEVCVFIRRGVDGLKLSSTRFFSPAKWRDFEAAVLSVRQQRPEARIVAIGFSFGSIELCRYLSMSGKRSLIHAALLVSCPFDPEAGGRNMRKRLLNRRIDAYLAKNLGKQLHQALFSSIEDKTHEEVKQLEQQCKNHNGSIINLNTLPKIKSLVDFEDNFNRVIQNYPTSEAYAADSRLQDHLAHIETPTLCLSSEDDFMAPLKLLPLEQIKANKNLCMVLTKRGGHMAFIDGLIWPKKPYFAQRIITSYMAALQSTTLAQPDPSEPLDHHQSHQLQYHRHHHHHHHRYHHTLHHHQKNHSSQPIKSHQSLFRMVKAHQ